MAALLRHGAARRLGGSLVQRVEAAVAEGRPVTRRLYSTDEGISEGKKSVKDVSDQVGATRRGFDWREIEFETISKCVAAVCNTVIKGGLLIAVLSECRPFRTYRL